MKRVFTNYLFQEEINFKLYMISFFIVAALFSGLNKLNGQASISGSVWHDLNGDGQQGGEPYMNGFTVELYNDAGVLQDTKTTSGGGTYSFTALAAGTYYVEFIINTPNIITPTGFGSATTNCDVTGANGAGTTDDIILAAASTVSNIDAGYYILATIGDLVFQDMNANGIRDGGDNGINGIDVTLGGFTGTGVPFNQAFVTAGGGLYQFTNVPPGTYTINFDDGGAYEITYQDEGADDNTDSDPDPATGDFGITIVSDDAITNIDCGMYVFGTIGNYTWEDVNGNGIQDGPDNDIPGIDVTLTGTTGNGTAVNDMRTSDGTGNYLFDEVIPGNYQLHFDQGTLPLKLTYADVGANDAVDSDADETSGNTVNFPIISDQDISNMDAGYFYYSTINGQTWHDLDGNGFKAGEPTIDGITVTLTGTLGTGAAMPVKVEVTAGGGLYEFDDVPPGTGFMLNFSLEPPYDSWTIPVPGGDSYPDPANGNTNTFDVNSNNLFEDIDAGYIRYVNIGDFVWEDMNGNGLQDGGEPGVPGVDVQLGDAFGNLIAATITDASGNYLFDNTFMLRPGDFIVAFLPPAGYAITDKDTGPDNIDSDADPGTGWTDVFHLESGDGSINWDAGIFRPPIIGDLCFRDQNTNGIQDGADFVFPNVEVYLMRSSDNAQIDYTVTNAGGLYQFGPDPDIKPGEYYIRFVVPATFLVTIQDAGDDTIDSDADMTGITGDYIIESGDENYTIDCGFYVEPPNDCDGETAGECVEAEVLCELSALNEFCTSMVPGWQQTSIPGCGSGYAFHNPSWFAFVAGAENIELIIHASPCVGGGGNIGIQWGIYDDCDLQGPVILQCPCVDPGDIGVNLYGLNVGQTYYFFIDGCSGTMCTYWIEIVSGGGVPEIFGPENIACDGNFPGCQDICVGADVTFTLEDVFNASHYSWDINGTIIETDDPELTTQFSEEGTFTVCAYGFNDCNEGEPFCFDVNIVSLPPEDLGSFEVCENDLEAGFDPPGWTGGTITTPGIHNTETQNALGCRYDQIVEIIELLYEEQTIDTIGCTNEDMLIEGQYFTYDVTDYEIIVPNAGTNGCNKRVWVTIKFLNIEGYIDAACSGLTDKPVKITFYPDQYSGSESITIQWLKDGWPIEDDDLTNIYDINVTEDGLYSMYITLSSEGHNCVFGDINEFFVEIETFRPIPPVSVDWPQSICSNENTYIPYTITGTNPDYTYSWEWPSDVFAANVSPNGSTLTINWFGSGGGDVCVHAVDPICGTSDTICLPVQVFAAPTAVFTLSDTMCLTSNNTVTYTGSGTNNGVYTWNFSGGTETSGTGGVGIGPHTISWGSAGDKIVSLEVTENGCISEFVEKNVHVVSPPASPNLICGQPTATSVSFEWDDPIVGATGITVIPVSGNIGTQNGNTYTVTDLNPLEEVTIQLFVQTDGICPSFTTDTVTCQAQDCPQISVKSTPGDTSICFDGTNGAFLLKYEINPAGSGVISWLGNGITDPATGMFDPVVAGIGDHTITLKYEFAECTFTSKSLIHIYEQPTANFSIGRDTICISDAATINYNGNAPTGTASWDFDNGIIVSGSGLAKHTIRWDSPGLKTVQLTVENNGCVSQAVSVPIVVQDTLDNIDIDCAPTVNDVTFTWNIDPLAESYRVFIDGVEVSNSLINSWVVNGLSPGDDVDITVIAVNSGVCGSKSASLPCEARECPTYAIDIFPDVTEVCLDADTAPIQFTANVTSSDGSGGTMTWSGPGINPGTGLFDPKAAGPGTHTLKLDYNGICTDDKTFMITVIETPTAQFSVEDDVICITDSVVVNFFSGNAVSSVYTWSLDGGQRTNINTSKFYLKWSKAGTYDILLNIDNKGCVSNEVKKTVTVDPELIKPVINCENATTNSVSISWNDIDCATNYIVLANGVEVANSSNLSYTVQNLGANEAVNFTVEAVSDCSCGNVTSIKSCKTEPCPNVALSIQDLPAHLCAAFAQTVKVNVNITGPQNGIQTWSGPGILSDGTINFQGLGTGNFVYNLNYTLENCSYNMKDSILITPEPVFQLSKEDPLCHNEVNGEISAPLQPGVQYYLAGESSPNGIFSGLGAGNYSVLARDTYGCETIESIDLINPPVLEPGISGDVVIKENQKNNFELINVDNINVSNIVWSLINEGVLCQGIECTTINLGIETDDTLCVEVFDENDCSAITCLAVTFLENIDINVPNIFSPDGDGSNDIFYVKADRSVEGIKEMRIFDRWGEMVFFQENVPVNDIAYGWNGEFKGKRLNPGVYVYYIVFKLKEREDMKLVGDVTIVK